MNATEDRTSMAAMRISEQSSEMRDVNALGSAIAELKQVYHEGAATVRKALVQSQNLHKASTVQEVQELLGCISLMDDHASKIIMRISEHRLDQEVKTECLEEGEYGEIHVLHHRVMSAAMKMKHSSGMEDVDTLIAAINALKRVCHDEGHTSAITEDAAAIRVAVLQSEELDNVSTEQDVHRLLQCLNTKEDHASKIVMRISEYFLEQEVKPELLAEASSGMSLC